MAETRLVVQWLRLRLPMQEVGMWPLVRELRAYTPLGQETKTENRSNIVTNSIKTLKMIHIKKSLGTSLVGQRLRLQSPSGEGLKFNPWSGNWIPHATTKTWHSQKKKIVNKKVNFMWKEFPTNIFLMQCKREGKINLTNTTLLTEEAGFWGQGRPLLFSLCSLCFVLKMFFF